MFGYVENTVKIGPATVTVFAVDNDRLEQVETSIAARRRRGASFELNTPMSAVPLNRDDSKPWVMKVRCEFDDKATVHEREVIADIVTRGVMTALPGIITYPSGAWDPDAEKKRGTDVSASHLKAGKFDMSSIYVMGETEARQTATKALEGVQDAREQWWKHELSANHDEKLTRAVAHALKSQVPCITPEQLVKAEALIQGSFDRTDQLTRRKAAQGARAKAFSFFASETGLEASLGVIGIMPVRSRHVMDELGNKLYPT